MLIERCDRREAQVEPEIGPDVAQRHGRDERAHVIEDETLDRAFFGCRDRHADQPAHRGADPVDLLEPQALEKPKDLRRVALDLVPLRIREPVAQPAARHVDADHAHGAGKPLGQGIEVAGIPRQPVNADHGARCFRVTPVREAQMQAPMLVAQGKSASPHHPLLHRPSPKLECGAGPSKGAGGRRRHEPPAHGAQSMRSGAILSPAEHARRASGRSVTRRRRRAAQP